MLLHTLRYILYRASCIPLLFINPYFTENLLSEIFLKRARKAVWKAVLTGRVASRASFLAREIRHKISLCYQLKKTKKKNKYIAKEKTRKTKAFAEKKTKKKKKSKKEKLKVVNNCIVSRCVCCVGCTFVLKRTRAFVYVST